MKFIKNKWCTFIYHDQFCKGITKNFVLETDPDYNNKDYHVIIFVTEKGLTGEISFYSIEIENFKYSK